MSNNNDDLTIGKFTKEYQHHVYQDDIAYNPSNLDNALMLHDVGHGIGEALTHTGHILDFEYAKSNLPPNRVAGYETEPIAVIYEAFLEGYSKDNPAFNNPEKLLDEILIISTEINIEILESDKEKLRNGEEIDKNRSKSHNEARRKYAENQESIIYPDDEEMLFHFEKAKELCENIKKHTGFYPSEIYADKTNMKFEDLPISLFDIDNIYHPPQKSQVLDGSHVQRVKDKQQTEKSQFPSF